MQLTINGQVKQLEQQKITVAQLVCNMQLTGKRVAIELNGVIVPRSQFESVALNEGDSLEIVGAVGGG